MKNPERCSGSEASLSTSRKSPFDYPLLGLFLSVLFSLLFIYPSFGAESLQRSPAIVSPFSLDQSLPLDESAFADLEKICDEDGFKRLCLEGLLLLRCQQHSLPMFRFGNACTRASKNFLTYLDLAPQKIQLEEADGTTKEYNLTIIFKTRLNALISEKITQDYLAALMKDFRRSARDGTPFNLWDYTLQFARGNRLKALEWLAVLFQDTSRTRVQIFHLRDREKIGKLGAAESKALGELQVVQELIRDDRFQKEGMPKWLTLYPEVAGVPLNGVLSPSPYHFYPMAYLSALLQIYLPRGSDEQAFMAFLPFLFNTEYEFRELEKSNWPFGQPDPFDPGPHDWKMRDIYAGLTGSLFGIGSLNEAEAFDAFVKAISSDPAGEMKRQFFRLYLR